MRYHKLLSLPRQCVHKLINHHFNWLGLAAALPLFGMATAWAIVQGNDAVPPADLQQQITQQLALPAFQFTPSTSRYWRDESVQRGDSIARVLNRLGIRASEAQRLLQSSPLSKDLLKLKVGATLSVQTNDSGELFGLRFLNDDENGERVLVAIEQLNGAWRASAAQLTSETLQTVRVIQIGPSLTQAFNRAKVPTEVREQLSEIFADQFNLSSLKRGDRINMVYETQLYNGMPIAVGNVLAVELERSGQRFQAFYLAHDSESGAYYDGNGKPLKKGFSYAPVANARISSGFGLRQHPILQNLRLHAGVDYAAASGTPVFAPADGVIIKQTQENGYGNMLELRHNDKTTTLYAHLSQFAANSQMGRKVKAGEVIAYVGNTGRSTGPHLHFEVRINEQAVDPASNALPAPKLNPGQLARFKTSQQQTLAQLNLLREIPTNLASLD
ncbi:M23 family metallopeptidase [Neisseriaceae bacterium TC5R-5]|nr:M23 family metallopeptidase [Neisseriaceae bacterium TC5R-5]